MSKSKLPPITEARIGRFVDNEFVSCTADDPGATIGLYRRLDDGRAEHVRDIVLPHPKTDLADVYAIARSLMDLGLTSSKAGLDLSDMHQGCDEAMRQAMAVAQAFENWANEHVDFDRTGMFAYDIEDRFGTAAVLLMDGNFISLIGKEAEVAAALKLPLR